MEFVITSFIDLINEGWIIKYNNQEEGKKKYLKKKEEPTVVVGVIGNRNRGKSFILELLSGYNIDSGFNIKTVGLSVRYGTSSEHNIAILDSAGQETPLLKKEKPNYFKDDNYFSEDDLQKNKNKTEKEKSDSKTEDNSEENLKDENKNNKKGETEESEDTEETPVKSKKKDNKNSKKNDNKDEESEEKKNIEFEKYSRDKLLTEYFIQKFIIWKSDIIILVVGDMTLSEQKLLFKVKRDVESLNKNKKIFVIHNLKEFTEEEDVNNYIENTLKKLYDIDIECIPYLNIKDEKVSNNNKYYPYYFVEKNGKVSHFIFINAFTEKSDYYNTPTIHQIQKEMEVIDSRNKFSLIEDCKKFLIDIAEDIMEETPTIDNLVILEEENNDRLVLKNMKDINLKSYAVDETGNTIRNNLETPDYSHYIKLIDNRLYINIELPGGGHIKKSITVEGNNYCFIFEGHKNGDKEIEEDKKNEVSKLICKKNFRKSNNFKLKIPIPFQLIQVIVPKGKKLKDAGILSKIEDDKNNEGRKGVYTFEYDVILTNQKGEESSENDFVL